MIDLRRWFGGAGWHRLDAVLAGLVVAGASQPTHGDLVARRDRARAQAEAGAHYHVDRFEIRLDLEGADDVVRHENGFVDVWGTATRVGVFQYTAPDGSAYPEYRPPDEVLDPESLATLVGVPFTIDHPADMVDSANSRDLTHGWVLAVRVDEGLVRTRIRIATDEALGVINGGTVELSCGYTAILDEVEGVSPDGEPFRAIQRAIRYNHLALVSRARAGAVARLHLDRDPRIQIPKSKTMHEIKIKIADRLVSITDAKSVAHMTYMLPACKAASDDLAARKDKGERLDLETAAMSFEYEGKPVELVLPAPMVEEMLGFLGVGGAPAAEAAPEAMPDDEAGDESAIPGAEGEDMGEGEAEDMGEGEAEEQDRANKADGKLDWLDMIGTASARARGDAKPAKVSKADAEAIQRFATVLKRDEYDGKSLADVHAAVALKLDASEENATELRRLANAANKGDARSAGMLAGMASAAANVLERARLADGQDVAELLGLKADTGDDDSPHVDRVDAARQKMLARRNRPLPTVGAAS